MVRPRGDEERSQGNRSASRRGRSVPQRKRTSVAAARTDARSRSRDMVASVSGRQERYEKRQRCVEAEEEKEAPM